MVSNCPKCGKTVSEDSVYCPYCGYGIQKTARTVQASAGSTLLMVSTVASLILFALSLKALAQIYGWYPPLIAQNFILYIQLLTVFTFVGFLFGLLASILSSARRSYKWTMVSAILCTLLSASSWVTSIIVPASNWGTSLFYFFLPLLIPVLIGTLLIYPKKAEFTHVIRKDKESS